MTSAQEKQRPSRVQSLKLGAAAQMLPLVAGYGANLLATPYIVFRLGLHDFGIWSITGAIAQYAALFDMGVSRAANRYVALFHAKNDKRNEAAVVGICLTALLALGVVLYAVVLAMYPLLDHVIGTNQSALARYLLLCAVTMLTSGLLARALASASIGRGRQVPANIGIAILSFSQIAFGVIALIISPELELFAAATAAGSVFGLLAVVTIILFDERGLTIGRPNAALARELISFGLKGQALGAADIVMFQSGKVIAGILINPAAAGVFELGSRLAQGAQSFGSVASVALQTHLTRAFAVGGKRSMLAEYPRLTQRNAAVAMFIPLLLAATSFSVIPLWLGDRNPHATLVLLALAPGVALNVATGVCTASMMALGRSGIVGAVAIVSAITGVSASLLLGHAFGFTGIAIGFGTALVLDNLLGVWFLQSRINISMTTYLRAIGGPLVTGVVAVAAALPVGIVAFPDSRATAIAPFFASFVLFCVIYLFIGWRNDYLPSLPIPAKLNGRFRHAVPVQDAEQDSISE